MEGVMAGQDNTTMKGLWGTIRSAFSEYGAAKKKDAEQKAQQVKESVASAGRAVRNGVRRVSTATAKAFKVGAKKTLAGATKGVVYTASLPRLAYEDFKTKASFVGRMAVSDARKFMAGAQKTRRSIKHTATALKSRALAWLSKRRQDVQAGYTAAREGLNTAGRSVRNGARRVSTATAKALKTGAKKTVAGVTKGVVYTASMPRLAYEEFKTQSRLVGRMAVSDARKLMASAQKTRRSIKHTATALKNRIMGWFSKRRQDVQAGYTAAREGLNAAGRSVRNGARRVSTATAKALKTGAKKTVSGVTKGVVYAASLHKLTIENMKTSAGYVRLVTVEKAKQLQERAQTAKTNIKQGMAALKSRAGSWLAKRRQDVQAGYAAVRDGMNATGRAVRDGVTSAGRAVKEGVTTAGRTVRDGVVSAGNATKSKAAQMLANAQRVIGGSQIVRNAKAMGMSAGRVIQAARSEAQRDVNKTIRAHRIMQAGFGK